MNKRRATANYQLPTAGRWQAPGQSRHATHTHTHTHTHIHRHRERPRGALVAAEQGDECNSNLVKPAELAKSEFAIHNSQFTIQETTC